VKFAFLKSAQAEFDDAVDYYADHASVRVAEAFVLDVQHARQRLVERPEIGPAISKRLRILRLKHFPYSIIYRVSVDTITIHAIAHQRRRPEYWSGRR
jgi:toxin ParE1/3/4